MSVNEEKDEYLECIKNSEKVNWRISDLLPKDRKLDMSTAWLAPTLTLENKMPFLSDDEKLKFNHIKSASYANLFAFVEEYITAEIVNAAQEITFDNNNRLRALLRFSEEEVKHQTLFLQFLEIFQENFATEVGVLQGAEEVAGVILSNSAPGVMFVTYHLELITQQHYIDNMKDNSGLNEQFTNLLKKHWQEEMQHAKLDSLELLNMTKDASPEEIQGCFEEYIGILGAFKGLLKNQAELDLESIQKASGRTFSEEEKEQFVHINWYSYVKMFILHGFENLLFRKFVDKLNPELMKMVEKNRQEILEEFKDLEEYKEIAA